MINVKKDRVKFKGSIPEVCYELSLLLNNLRKAIAEKTTDEIAKDMIIKAVKLGLKSDEELEKDLEEICRNLENYFDKEGEDNE